jgi:hypothetical protein
VKTKTIINYNWIKLWELNQVEKELLNQLGSQIGVDGIIRKLLGIRHHLSLTNIRKVTNKEIIASNKSFQSTANASAEFRLGVLGE